MPFRVGEGVGFGNKYDQGNGLTGKGQEINGFFEDEEKFWNDFTTKEPS